jgi:hypothetical protein
MTAEWRDTDQALTITIRRLPLVSQRMIHGIGGKPDGTTTIHLCAGHIIQPFILATLIGTLMVVTSTPAIAIALHMRMVEGEDEDMEPRELLEQRAEVSYVEVEEMKSVPAVAPPGVSIYPQVTKRLRARVGIRQQLRHHQGCQQEEKAVIPLV